MNLSKPPSLETFHAASSSHSSKSSDIESPKVIDNIIPLRSSTSSIQSPLTKSSKGISLLTKAFSFGSRSTARNVESPVSDRERTMSNDLDDDLDNSVTDTITTVQMTSRKNYCSKHPDIKISNIRETFSFVPISRECYRCADEHKLRMEREREEIESRKLLTNSAIPGIISTVAGTGIAGYTGQDGGPATAAEIHFPVGVCVDSNNNIYFADSLNNCIRKIDATVGNITTIIGTGMKGSSGDGGLARKAKLCHPWGVCVDHLDNIYIADTGNNRIRKVSAKSNIISTVAGNGSPGYYGDDGLCIHSKIDSPSDLVTDADGNLYFTDTNNNRIRKIDFANGGIISTIAGTGGDGFRGDGGSPLLAEIHRPLGLALDSKGNIYVTDSCNHRIRKISHTGDGAIITTIAGRGDSGFSSDGIYATHTRLNLPWGIAVDSLNNVYFADSDNHRIRKISEATKIISTLAGIGVEGFSGDREKARDAHLNAPWGLCLDKRGNLYLADGENHRIRKINLNPVSKWGMAADSSGNVYFGDGDNFLLRKLNIASGKIELIKSAESITKEFEGAWSVAIDSGGTMWVVDNINDQVQQITPEGEITKLAMMGDESDSKLLLYDTNKEKLLATYDTVKSKAAKSEISSLSPKTLQSIKLKNEPDKSSPLMKKQVPKLFNKTNLKLKLNLESGASTEQPLDISPSSESPLSPSFGMTVDKNGNIFLANKDNQNILKFCP